MRAQARRSGNGRLCSIVSGGPVVWLGAALLVWLGPRAGALAGPPDTQPRSGNVQPGSEPRAERPVLLLMTERDELGEAIVRAVETELNDVDLGLERLDMTGAAELRERIEAAERLVREREALGLIWIEPRADGLVVHLVVADAGMLRRPVVGLDDPRAAIETAAVIVRHFATDLMAGRPIGLTRLPERELETPQHEGGDESGGEGGDEGEGEGEDEGGGEGEGGDKAPTPSEAPPDSDRPERPRRAPLAPLLGDRGRFHLQAGYVGQTWIRERAWEHGVEVNLGWRFAVGAHVEAGVAISPAFEAELQHPLNLGVAQLRVRRYPVALTVGYQRVWPKSRLALDAQLRVVAEVVERGLFDPAKVTPRLDRPVLVVPALEPRLVLDYLAIPQLAVFVAVGMRASLVRVDYRITYVDEQGAVVGDEAPLHPRVLAPVILGGLDMYF